MNSSPDPLITTRYKNPLAKGTSYPFGAELASKILFGVPQYKELEIGFYRGCSRNTSFKQEFHTIVKVDYFKHQASYGTSNDSWGQTYLESNWLITVYPILSNHRKCFRDYLDNGGWSLMRNWLIDQWPNNQRIGKASLIISACQSSQEIKHLTESSIMPAKS